ncbi:MAG: FHA domain-containing protein [Burkholderiaceae bacterium]|jgi:pSer/pThr/pTyr-binding forkhead associated (FHA) protein|nr:MAG: FHA domain-containing protein [Burkholderiaceae bacterium]
MAELTFSLRGELIQRVELPPGRITIGRRSDNDVVLPDPTVSGRHAAVENADGRIVVEDLGSTNGTLVCRRKMHKQALADGDSLSIGKYTATCRIPASAGPAADPGVAATEPSDSAAVPRLRVLTGAAAGRGLALVNDVTTLGKRGVSVAAITRTEHGYTLAQVEGAGTLKVNHVVLGPAPVRLHDQDEIEIAATRLLYLES